MSQRTNALGTNMDTREDKETTWKERRALKFTAEVHIRFLLTWYSPQRITVCERNCLGVRFLIRENWRQNMKNVAKVTQEAIASKAISSAVI